MLSTKFLVIVIICISIFNGAYGHGVLHVDNVYSSANRQIKVDNLVSTAAITTTTETHEVEFKQHRSLAMSAPELTLAGSYLSIVTQNNVQFVSDDSTIDLQGGHNFDTNSKTFSLIGDDVELESAGQINLLSRDQIGMIGRNVNFLAGNGGIDLSSATGPIIVSTNGTLSFDSSTGLSIEATRDITLRTEGSLIADVSTGFASLYSDGKVQLTSSNDITFTSSSDFISLEADQFYLTANNFSAIGTYGQISSNVDDVNIFGYERILLDAESIEVTGSGSGTQWRSESGYIDLASQNGNIHFIANSASDDSRVVTEADLLSFETNDDFTINALTGILFTSEFDMDLLIDRSVSVTSRRDTFVRSESEINYTAATNFATTANTLIFTTFDEATADATHGLIQLSALLPTYDVETLFGISAASLQVSARTTVSVTATDDLTILADYSDGTSHQLAINAGIFTMASGSLQVEGGDIVLSGSTSTFRTTSDLTINADKEKTSYLDFASKTNRWTVQSFDHTAGESLIQSQGSTTMTVGGKTAFSTSRIHDISMVLDSYTATAGKDINTQVTGDLSILVEEAGSFSTSADFRVNSDDFFSTNYRFSIFSSSLTVSTDDLVITTDRNEETNDYLRFVFTDVGDFTINNLVYVSGEETQILSNGQTYNAASITLSSDDLMPITFDVGSSLISAAEDLTIRGNNIAFSAFKELDFKASSFEIEAESNGIEVTSGGFISLSVMGDFTVETVDELIISSVGRYDHTTDDATLTFDELSYIHSNGGTVDLSGSVVSFFNRDNVTVSSGNSPDDYIKINTGSLTFFGPTQKYFSLSTPEGLTSIVASSSAAGATTSIIASSFSQSSGGLTSFTAGTSYAFTANSIYSEGGDITVQSLLTDITIDASDDSTISFTNQAASLASEEFLDQDDLLSFSSTTGSIVFIDTDATSADFTAGGSIHVATHSPTNVGAINYIAQAGNVIFQSTHSAEQTPLDHENYDISFTSGGDFIINVVTDATIDSSGDFMIHADKAITFTQQQFEAQIWDDFTIKSDLGSVFVDHTGNFIHIATNNVDVPTLERENTLEFNSQQRMSVYANDEIRFTVSGYGTTRRDVDGESNMEEQWDQPIAFSLRTYDPQGDFIVQARNDFINIDTFGTTIFDTDSSALIETHREQDWQNDGLFTMEATDGGVFIYGADGIDVNVKLNTYFLSSRYTDFIADNTFNANAALDFFISSYHGDISFANYQTNDVLWTSNAYTKVTGGSELNVIAQGDISFTATDDIIITGDRGYYLTTSGQEITFTGTTFGSTVTSSEEINLLAGGDLYLINQGNTNEDMKFTGDGVVFQTSAGDITFTAGNLAQITSEIILVNAFGTSSTGRDTAQFQSGTSTTFQTEGEIRINANNLFDLGEDLNPPVITFSAGDVAFLSQGNYEMKIDGALYVNAADGRTALSSIASTTVIAGTALSLTAATADLSVHALHGSIGIFAQGDFSEFFEDEINIISQGLTTFTTGFVDVTSNSFTSEADFLQKISVGTDFTVNGATDGAITTSFNPTDEITLSATAATINPSRDFKWSAINNINLFLGDAFFDIAGGNTIFTGHDASTDIIFGSAAAVSFTVTDDLMFNSKSLDIDVNLRPGAARGNFAATVTGNYLNNANSFLFESNGDYRPTAPIATSTVGDYFRVLAVQDVLLNSATLLDIDTENTFIGTRPYIAGSAPYSHDLKWDATTYTINANGDVVFDALVNNLAATTSTTLTGSGVTVNNFGQISHTHFSSDGDYTINPSVSYTSFSGSNTGHGAMNLFATNVNVASDTLSLLSTATETQPAGNAFIGANSDLTLSGDTFLATARSTTEEQQGTIEISVSGTNTFASDTLSFTSQNAGFNSQSDTSLAITATTSMASLTHGLNAGIDLFGKTLTPLTTATLTSTAAIDHKIIATNGNLDWVTLTSLGISSDGKAASEDAGIQFKTDNDAGVIRFLTTTTLFSTLGSFDVHATDSILSSSTTTTAIGSKYANFKTVGLANNLGVVPPVGAQPVGMQITAGTMDFNSVNDDTTFTATGTVSTFFNTGTTVLQGDATYYTAHGTVQLNVPALAHTPATIGNIAFIAHENGITFGAEDVDLNIAATNAINLNTGVLQEYAQFRTTAPAILFTSVGLNTLSADNNALFNSNALTTFQSTTDDTIIDATKGDILFRSIDSPVNTIPHSLRFSATNIYMTAYYRVEHRQHQEVGFFTPGSQLSRASTSAVRQGTTLYTQFNPTGPLVNGCFCTINCDTTIVGCPSVTARLIQMQAALIQYGLLDIVTVDNSNGP